MQNNDLSIDAIKAISSLQIAFTHKDKKLKTGKQKAKIIISDFNPFSNLHLELIEKIKKDNDEDVLLVFIKRDVIGYSEKTFDLSDDLVEKILLKTIHDYQGLIKGAFIISRSSIVELIKVAKSQDFNITELYVQDGESYNYMSQLYTEETVLGRKLGVEKDFAIHEYENKNMDIVRTIEDNDAHGFKRLVPKCVSAFWDNIITEYELWANIPTSEIQIFEEEKKEEKLSKNDIKKGDIYKVTKKFWAWIHASDSPDEFEFKKDAKLRVDMLPDSDDDKNKVVFSTEDSNFEHMYTMDFDDFAKNIKKDDGKDDDDKKDDKKEDDDLDIDL